MGSFADGLREGLKTAYCSQVASSPQWFTNLRRVLVPNPLREGADNLYRWICDNPNAPELPPPPFTGGQCPIAYRVTITFDVILLETGEVFVANNTNTSEAFNVYPVGPIGGVSLSPGPTGDPTLTVSGGGQAYYFGVNSSPATFDFRNIRLTRVEPQDPLAVDNCGDPGPDIPDDPAPINIDVDVTYGPNNEFSLTVPVVLAPVFINAKGELNIPVTVSIDPNFNISGTLEIFPGFEFSPQFPGGPDGGPITDPPPQNPTGPGSGDPTDPEEEPEVEPLIIGVLVAAVIQSEARPSSIFQETGPDIFAPRLATARFGRLIANQIFWSEDIPVKGLRSYVPCPFQFGANLVVVNAESGVGLSYSPVFSDPQDWPPYLALGDDQLSDNRFAE